MHELTHAFPYQLRGYAGAAVLARHGPVAEGGLVPFFEKHTIPAYSKHIKTAQPGTGIAMLSFPIEKVSQIHRLTLILLVKFWLVSLIGNGAYLR